MKKRYLTVEDLAHLKVGDIVQVDRRHYGPVKTFFLKVIFNGPKLLSLHVIGDADGKNGWECPQRRPHENWLNTFWLPLYGDTGEGRLYVAE